MSPKKPAPEATDEMGKDVLKLEALLRTQAKKIEFWQAIELEGDTASDVDNEIGWAEHGKFRLVHRRTKFDRHDEAVSEKTTPLIDAPAAIRGKLHALLPLFMEEFATHLASGNAPDLDPGLEEDEDRDEDDEDEDADDAEAAGDNRGEN